MITYSINEPEIVGFTDLEVCMRLTVGALGMDLTLLVEWVPGRATGVLISRTYISSTTLLIKEPYVR